MSIRQLNLFDKANQTKQNNSGKELGSLVETSYVPSNVLSFPKNLIKPQLDEDDEETDREYWEKLANVALINYSGLNPRTVLKEIKESGYYVGEIPKDKSKAWQKLYAVRQDVRINSKRCGLSDVLYKIGQKNKENHNARRDYLV
jgi:hypothetical protein